jgi:hypothetical protein
MSICQCTSSSLLLLLLLFLYSTHNHNQLLIELISLSFLLICRSSNGIVRIHMTNRIDIKQILVTNVVDHILNENIRSCTVSMLTYVNEFSLRINNEKILRSSVEFLGHLTMRDKATVRSHYSRTCRIAQYLTHPS